MIHLDTHVVVWLYAGEMARIPINVRECIEQFTPVISPMVDLELQYLHEIGRIAPSGLTVVEDLTRRIGLQRATIGFDAIVAAAMGLRWTRDPFDRLIVATAIASGAQLLTADERILQHVPAVAFWG